MGTTGVGCDCCCNEADGGKSTTGCIEFDCVGILVDDWIKVDAKGCGAEAPMLLLLLACTEIKFCWAITGICATTGWTGCWGGKCCAVIPGWIPDAGFTYCGCCCCC